MKRVSSNCLFFGDCPKPKKSKTSDQDEKDATFNSNWSCLPAVILHEVFCLLNKEDRKNASTVCKHWRRTNFHPKFWHDITFEIKHNKLEKSRFQIATFAETCQHARIKLDSLSEECMNEFLLLLYFFCRNNKLKSIIIEPSHCRFEGLYCKKTKRELFQLLGPLLCKLTKFSIGCIEDLSQFVEDILVHLDPKKLIILGLASVKYDPINYQPSNLEPKLILPFVNLRILSVDYDNVSDSFLTNLHNVQNLERLVVHLHHVAKDHPGTTNVAWRQFSSTHPNCELRLNVVHAFNDISKLHETVMRPAMPLTHFRAFFCEMVNVDLVNNLANYSSTLRSVMWIDSMKVGHRFEQDSVLGNPDPFVLLAWLCRKLEEFVLYGYKYWEENLVAIGRLREDTLKRFEVLEEDIVYGDHGKEGAEKTWTEIKTADVHLVVRNPAEGDSDEFMLPIVLADLDLS